MMFTFGADPELALIHKNQFKSAIGILPDKKRAIKKDGTAFYFDNVFAEMGIKPAKTKKETVDNIRNALQHLVNLVRPAKIVIRASMTFPASELKHKKAIEAGCVPEMSAYSLRRVLPPKAFIIKDEKTDELRHTTPFRTVGGHIHLGAEVGPLQHGLLVPYVVKMLDLFLGIPDLFFNKDKTAKDRRKVCGTAGTHRTPEYGVEYRPLSNYWFSSPIYVNLVYDVCDFILDFIEQNGHLRFWEINQNLLDEDDPSVAHFCYGYDVNLLQDAINNCDKKIAKPFMTFIGNYMPNLLYRQIEKAIEYQPRDLYEEWNL